MDSDDEKRKSLFAHFVSGNGNIGPINSSSGSSSGSFRSDESRTANGPKRPKNLGVGNSNSIVSTSTFKRWNSVPMGINYNYCIRCPDPSSSSSSSSDEDEDSSNDPNRSEIIPSLANIERKSASLCYDRRPSSASSGAYAIRHRSSSSALFFPSLPFRLLDKGIEKLKREANVRSCIETDYAGEKMSITGAAIMYSMDEFNIADGNSADASNGNLEQRRRTQSLTEPVHVLTNLLPASCSPTPSPTRIEKQCYSPSMQQVVRSIAMSPTSSPSPTRRQCIRSLSPIALRTGMGLKRKYDSDAEGYAGSSSKRAHYSVPTTPPVTAAENPRTPVMFSSAAQSLNHSLSESSIDSECSISTISSDFTNISNASHGLFHQNRSLSNIAAASSSSAYPVVMEDFPIIEESIVDEEDA